MRWPIFGIIVFSNIDPVSRSQISPTDMGRIVLFGLLSNVSMVAVRNFEVLDGIWLDAILFSIVNMFIFMSWPHEKICFIREALHPVMPLAFTFNRLIPIAMSS